MVKKTKEMSVFFSVGVNKFHGSKDVRRAFKAWTFQEIETFKLDLKAEQLSLKGSKSQFMLGNCLAKHRTDGKHFHFYTRYFFFPREGDLFFCFSRFLCLEDFELLFFIKEMSIKMKGGNYMKVFLLIQ